MKKERMLNMRSFCKLRRNQGRCRDTNYRCQYYDFCNPSYYRRGDDEKNIAGNPRSWTDEYINKVGIN